MSRTLRVEYHGAIHHVMPFRNITLISILIVVLILIALFVTPTVQEAPQVRLVSLTYRAVEPGAWLLETNGWLTAEVSESQQEMWNAEFEIHNPPGSGILLSLGEIGVEVLDAGGRWTAATLPHIGPGRDIPWLPWLQDESTARIVTKRIKASVPSETRLCRIAIRLRPLTPQERCRHVFARWGLWSRFPRLSKWISDRFPGRKRWREYRPEVVLPRVMLQQEVHDHSPGKA